MLKTIWQVRLVRVLATIASIDAAPPGNAVKHFCSWIRKNSDFRDGIRILAKRVSTSVK
jgi:hypothetical protein